MRFGVSVHSFFSHSLRRPSQQLRTGQHRSFTCLIGQTSEPIATFSLKSGVVVKVDTFAFGHEALLPILS